MIRRFATYPVLAKARPLAQLLDHALQLLLKQGLPLALSIRVSRQGKDPLLHDRPHVRRGLPRSSVVNHVLPGLGSVAIYVAVAVAVDLAVGGSVGVGGAVDVPVVAGVVGVCQARHRGMPLGKTSGNGSQDERVTEVLGTGNCAQDVAVQHAILEAGEQLRGEAMPHEQLMVLSLTFAVDEDGSPMTVGAEQDGVLVHVNLGHARTAVDSLEQGVCDAISEAHKLNVGILACPVRHEGQDEFSCRVIRVIIVVGQVKEGHMAKLNVGR